MPSLTQRIDRLAELTFLATRHAAGLAGVQALLRCYAATFTDPMSTAPIALPLRAAGRRATLRMRARDLYTVAEIFRERQYALARPLPASPVIVDAGANIGVATTWFRLLHPDAMIVAIEPVEENHGWLLRNLQDDPRAVAVRAALGNATGQAVMALATHGAEHAVGGKPGAPHTESVPLRRLDDVLAEQHLDRVDLLKLDVEGSEVAALEGLGDHLQCVGAIVAEVHERQIDVAAFHALVEASGFEVVRRRYYREGRESGVHTMEAWRRRDATRGPG